MPKTKNSSSRLGLTTQARMSREEVIQRWIDGVYITNPELWPKDALDITLDPWQVDAFRKLFTSPKRRLSTRASHGAGKTLMSAIFTHFFLFNFSPSLVCLTGPTGKQTRAQVWSMVSRLHEKSVFKDDLTWYRTKMALKGHEEETFSHWVSSKNSKTIEGMHGPLEGENLLWIIEEAKAVDDSVYEAISGAMSHKNCFWYISSTCGASVGKFYQSHTSLRDEWETCHVPYTQCPRIDLESVRRWEKDWGKDSAMFKARALAEFPNSEEFAICSLDWLERAVHRDDEDEAA